MESNCHITAALLHAKGWQNWQHVPWPGLSPIPGPGRAKGPTVDGLDKIPWWARFSPWVVFCPPLITTMGATCPKQALPTQFHLYAPNMETCHIKVIPSSCPKVHWSMRWLLWPISGVGTLLVWTHCGYAGNISLHTTVPDIGPLLPRVIHSPMLKAQVSLTCIGRGRGRNHIPRSLNSQPTEEKAS